VLVVFLALVLPNLPGLRQAPSNIGISVVKVVALLYAIEMLLSHSGRYGAGRGGVRGCGRHRGAAGAAAPGRALTVSRAAARKESSCPFPGKSTRISRKK